MTAAVASMTAFVSVTVAILAVTVQQRYKKYAAIPVIVPIHNADKTS